MQNKFLIMFLPQDMVHEREREWDGGGAEHIHL